MNSNILTCALISDLTLSIWSEMRANVNTFDFMGPNNVSTAYEGMRVSISKHLTPLQNVQI